jgi:hypothetical protein
MSEPITELMNDTQWAEYLSDVLTRLDTHAHQLPAGTTLRELIEATVRAARLFDRLFRRRHFGRFRRAGSPMSVRTHTQCSTMA